MLNNVETNKINKDNKVLMYLTMVIIESHLICAYAVMLVCRKVYVYKLLQITIIISK